MSDHAVNEVLAGVARQLDGAGHGARGSLVQTACASLGWQPQRLYTELKQRVGWVSGRRVRADKGMSRQSMEAVKAIAGMQRETVRKNGKQIMYLPVAASIAQANAIPVAVSTGHLARLMRQRHLSARALATPEPVTELRSLHPNHVHQVDPSLCVLYYMNGRQRIMRDDEFYKNKLENYAKVTAKVWRYVLTDHASSSVTVRYYEAAGETALTLFEFLIWAWSLSSQRPQHGVPRILMMDLGSANQSAALLRFVDDLDVEAIPHAKGRSRVKGQVEGAQNIVETQFESRLALEPVDNVGQLNARAEDWSRAFNANAIPHQDTRLHRGPLRAARTDLWLTILQAQLRLCPPVALCRALFAGREETRKVTGHLRINFKHPAALHTREYELRNLPGINVGDEVRVRPMVFGDCAIKVLVGRYDGADLVYRVEPLADYDQFGFSAAAATIGEEYRDSKRTDIEAGALAADAAARPGMDADAVERARDKHVRPSFGRGEGKGLDAHSHLAGVETPVTLPKRGVEIATPAAATATVQKRSATQLAIQLARDLAHPLTDTEWAWLNREAAAWPDGAVPEHETAALIERFTRRANFTIINGGQQ